MKIQKKRKWTIFFVIKSIDESFDEMVTMLNEIRGISYPESMSFLFCLYIPKGKLSGLLRGETNPNIQGPNHLVTVYLTLTPDPERVSGYLNKLEVTYEHPIERHFQITTAEDLKEFFITGSSEEYQAERYVVFTWNHGKYYGIYERASLRLKFLYFKRILDEFIPANNFDVIDHFIALNDSSIAEDNRIQVNDSILTMEELNAAFKSSFNQKVDLLVMMNCSMQFLDTGYALRESVEYLIASELIINYFGYNYPDIFQKLANTTNISSEDFAKHIINAQKTKALPDVDMTLYARNFTAIFAVRLEKHNSLLDLVDRLATHLIQKISARKTDIVKAKRKCFISRLFGVVDFYSFIHELETLGIFDNNPELLGQINLIRKDIIVESYIGHAFKPDTGLSKLRPSGFSIYFPAILQSPAEFPSNGFIRTDFFNRSKWKKFLKECQEL